MPLTTSIDGLWQNPTSDTSLPPLHCKSSRYLRQQDSGQATYGKSPALQYTTGGQQDHKGHRLHLANCVGFLLHGVQAKRKPSTRPPSASKALLTEFELLKANQLSKLILDLTKNKPKYIRNPASDHAL